MIPLVVFGSLTDIAPVYSFGTSSYSKFMGVKSVLTSVIKAVSSIITPSYLPLHILSCMLPEWHSMDTYSLLCLANVPHDSSQICLPDIFNLQLFLVPVCRHAKLSETEWEVSRDGEHGRDNMEPRFLCPCLVLISLERQRWPCWVKASTSRATGLDSWPWSGRWEVTREVGVGSVYAGLQRARERGNVCVCLCYR